MHLWRAKHDPNIDGVVHQVATGFGHALLAPIVSTFFQVLRVSAAVWEHGAEWFSLHSSPSLFGFELEHGKELERYAYNARWLAEARRRRKAVQGNHAGYHDLFVPVVVGQRAIAVLVTGPFMLARPASAKIVERWRRLTGRQGHLSDPEFAAYLGTTLSTLVLDARNAVLFEQLVKCLAQLMAGEGRADELTNRARALGAVLEDTRRVERTWEAVQAMVDERTWRAWQSTVRLNDRRRLGLPRTPDEVLVALTVGRFAGTDAVDEAVRRDAFQRRAVDLARKTGDVLAGRVGDHGVVFISGTGGPARKRRRKLVSLMEQAARVGLQEFDLSMHFGSSGASPAIPLSQSYEAALGAAETALARGTKAVVAEPGGVTPSPSMRLLRQELAKATEEQPDRLGARFDRYLESVAVQCGYRIDSARGHLEAGFERIVEPLVESGGLDERSFAALCRALDRASGEARTTSDLLAAYRRAVAEVSAALQRPAAARRDRSLRRAVEYIHQHYAEPLPFGKVARLAGFSPNYFSALFRQREGMTFELYVRALRLERAKQLLVSTELGVARVAELSGFQSSQYFARVFRRAVGTTPIAYRAKARLPARGRGSRGRSEPAPR